MKLFENKCPLIENFGKYGGVFGVDYSLYENFANPVIPDVVFPELTSLNKLKFGPVEYFKGKAFSNGIYKLQLIHNILIQHNCIVIKAYKPANLLPISPINTAIQPKIIMAYDKNKVSLVTPKTNGD